MTWRGIWILLCSLILTFMVSACSNDPSAVTPVAGAGSEAPSGSQPPGNSEENSGSPSGNTISGLAADGYLRGATVCLDLNNNGRCDEGEPAAITGEGGAFTLEVGDLDANAYPVAVTVTTETVDEDGNVQVAKGYTLRAPAGEYGFVSPLTTLIQTKIDQNPSLDVEGAAQMVGLQLNVEDPTKFVSDYVLGGNEDSELADLHKSAQIVARAFGEVMEAVATATGNLEGAEELRAVQVVAGKLLLSKLDQVAVAVQKGSETFDPDSAATSLGVGAEAGALAAEEFATVAQQINAIKNSTLGKAGAVLPGNTIFSFRETGTQDGPSGSHTIIEFERMNFGQTSVESSDAFDSEIDTLDDLANTSSDGDGDGADDGDGDGDGGDAAGFTVTAGTMVFSAEDVVTETHLVSTAVVDLAGLRFKLGDLALSKMQDPVLRAREVVFAEGDLMYKIKAVYKPTDIAMAAEVLVNEMTEEEEGYENGNSVDQLKNYAATRNVNFPLFDHGVVIGPNTYLKYFVPDQPGSVTGLLMGVREGDPTDRIKLGRYRIEALQNGRAYILMDLLGFAEVNGVWDNLLVVNDAQSNHNFWEVLIADIIGSKSSELLYFNRSAMEKIFSVVKNSP